MRRIAIALVALAGVGAPLAWGAVRHRDGGFEAGRDSLLVTAGSLRTPLRPGSGALLDLHLRNLRPRPVLVTRLHIRARVVGAPGCSRRDFAFRPIALSSYPIRVPSRNTRRLSRLGVHPLPRIRMKNLARNQDACKNVRLAIRYQAWTRLP